MFGAHVTKSVFDHWLSWLRHLGWQIREKPEENGSTFYVVDELRNGDFPVRCCSGAAYTTGGRRKYVIHLFVPTSPGD